MTLLFIAFAFPYLGSSQEVSTDEITFKVNRIYPYISIAKEKLNEANTLRDLHPHYKSSWIREYISVEILTTHEGKISKAVGKNDILNQKQKDVMKMADLGADISIKVRYIPENTLKHNEPKEMNFSFTVDPESEATYPSGPQQLQQYLQEKAIDKIPAGSFKNYDFTAVKFTVDEDGQIIDAHIFDAVYQMSKNEKIDALLLEAIRNMPRWKPAEYANGTKVKQEFVLTVGNHENCSIHLLNIRLN